MKKLLVMLCLLLAIVPAALAAQGDAVVARRGDESFQDYVSSSCAIGDTLYLMGNESLYTYRVGDADVVKYPFVMKPEDFGMDAMNAYVNACLFNDGDQLRVLARVTDYSGEESIQENYICSLTLENGAVSWEKLMESDWSEVEEETGYLQNNNLIGMSGYAAMLGFSEMGDEILCIIDLSDGSIRKTDVEFAYIVTPYTENRLLVEQFDYNNTEVITFAVYDPATDTVEPLSEIPTEDYRRIEGLLCNPETGEAYCAKAGEIFRIDLLTGEMSEGIADMPVEIYSDRTPHFLEGGYYACSSYEATVIRNLNPAERPSVRLKVFDGSYAQAVNSAYYSFSNTHSDVSLVLSREYSEAENLLEAMMSRDSSIDVYILYAADGFETLRDRGYLAELTSSEWLMDAASRMHPNLLRQLSCNGGLAAYPVDNYFMIPYINVGLLERMGYKLEDVPNNWMEFLDFLSELELPEGCSLLDNYTTWHYAKQELFYSIFETYQRELSRDDGMISLSSSQMAELFRKVESLDYGALGQPEEENYDYDYDYNQNNILLTLNMGMGIAGITNRDETQPFLLSLSPDSDPILPMTTSVIFVNPFSQNAELAAAFVEEVAKSLEDSVTFLLYPDEMEPVPNPYYEEQLAHAEEYLAQMQKLLDEAEEIDRQAYERELKYAQENYDYTVENKWMISEEDIEWYRSNADKVLVDTGNWLWSDESGEAQELVRQYLDGQIDVRQFMNAIDGKIKMMLMEGY